ncbi:MAG: helical backbone metal receptor [Deltaproteobacteria bacterium]|nr:helical backbone metal receptor [Deltaproteobacteria bacterium]
MFSFSQKLKVGFKLIILGLGLALTILVHQRLAARQAPRPAPTDPHRIISLAPSVTETLFALGLGERVVGRTRYCLYPPAAQAVPIVASFSELNYEAIVRRQPDLVALPADRLGDQARLSRLGLPVLPLDTRSLAGYRQAVTELGQKLGRLQSSQAILRNIERSSQRARQNAQGQPRPRVLFSVMRDYEGLGYITEINAVGQDGFYSQILDITGARNAYEGPLAFPRLSRESIIFLNPDVIVDVILTVEDLESVRRDWASLASVKATRDNRIHFLTQQADTVPGPRIYLTIERLSAFFHPRAETTP